MHDPEQLLRPARSHEAGELLVLAMALREGLHSHQDHGERVEALGAVDGEVADALLLCQGPAPFVIPLLLLLLPPRVVLRANIGPARKAPLQEVPVPPEKDPKVKGTAI